MKYVIIGGGVAAVEAAVAIRKNSAEAEITVCSAEKCYPYRRPFLSKGLLKGFEGDGFLQKTAEFYQRENITVKLNCRAEAIEPEKKLVRFADGSSMEYDKLLLATGAKSFRIPIPGSDLPQVMTLRELPDAERIREILAQGVKHAMIIGGGVLGLELAEVLLEAGCAKVSIAECAPVLLSRNLDAASSAQLQEHLAGISGLELRLGEKIECITPETADLVIMSIGAVPEISLAKNCGIPCGRGICTDEFLRTGVADIYAAGDCAEMENCVTGIYTTAAEMGKTAGNNMSGAETPFVPPACSMRFMGFGIKLFSSGCLEGEMEEFTDGANVKRLFYQNGKLAGAVLFGDMRESMKLFNTIMGK